jgi:hypothetical protein
VSCAPDRCQWGLFRLSGKHLVCSKSSHSHSGDTRKHWHSNGLVKGYHGGSAVPLNDASHLRFIIGGNETMIMEE